MSAAARAASNIAAAKLAFPDLPDDTEWKFFAQYKRTNHRFRMYREEGWVPTAKDLYNERDLWMRPARSRLPTPKWPLEYSPARYGVWSPRGKLSGAPAPPDNKSLARAQARHKEVTEWFEDEADRTGSFRKVRALGFGGLGLALHYQYQRSGFKSRDFVIKFGLEGPESAAIRDEERNAKVIKLGRHILSCIANELAASGLCSPLRPVDQSRRNRTAS